MITKKLIRSSAWSHLIVLCCLPFSAPSHSSWLFYVPSSSFLLLFLFKLNEIFFFLFLLFLGTRFCVMEGDGGEHRGPRFDHDGDDEGEKKRNVFTSSFSLFFSFFSYNKPENEPGTRKKWRKKNVNEARDGKEKKSWSEKEYLKTGFFRERFQSNWIQLRESAGPFRIDG